MSSKPQTARGTPHPEGSTGTHARDRLITPVDASWTPRYGLYDDLDGDFDDFEDDPDDFDDDFDEDFEDEGEEDEWAVPERPSRDET